MIYMSPRRKQWVRYSDQALTRGFAFNSNNKLALGTARDPYAIFRFYVSFSASRKLLNLL